MSDLFNREKIKTFVLYTVFIVTIMMFFLVVIDLMVDFYFGTFRFENFLWQDVPVDLFISISIALVGWFFNDKRLEAKNKYIELDLNNKDGEKDK